VPILCYEEEKEINKKEVRREKKKE